MFMKPLILAVLFVLLTSVAPVLAPDAGLHAKESKAEKAARKRAEQEMAYQALQRGEILPLAQILTMSQRYVPGEVIKIELDQGKLIYKLRVLPADGRVRKLDLDARNGQLIKLDNS